MLAAFSLPKGKVISSQRAPHDLRERKAELIRAAGSELPTAAYLRGWGSRDIEEGGGGTEERVGRRKKGGRRRKGREGCSY